MALAPLPLALPVGIGDAGSYLDYPVPTQPNAWTADWLVPGGEVWLLVAIGAESLYGGGVGNKSVSLTLFDQDSNRRWKDISTVFMTGAVGSTAMNMNYALGSSLKPVSRTDAANDGTYQQTLPWLGAPAGFTWELFLEANQSQGSVQAPAGDQGAPRAMVLRIEDAGGGGAGGVATPVASGPYLYVPGPEEPVAA